MDHRVVGKLPCRSDLDVMVGGCQGRQGVAVLRFTAMVDSQNDNSAMKMVVWRLT